MAGIVCMIIFLLAAIAIVIMVIDCNRFVMREYTIKNRKLNKNITMVLLADLHNKSFGAENEKLLRAIRQITPDLILIAGDMYTSNTGGSTETAVRLVSKLATEYPVYCADGNHEQKTRLFPEQFGSMYKEYADTIQEAGAKILLNEKTELPNLNLNIYGLDADRSFYGKFKKRNMEKEYLEELMGKTNASSVNLLLAHNPDFFPAYAKWGADLVLSGHVHGGLVKLPLLGGAINPALKLFPKYDGGIFKSGNSTMVLSRGLGTHTLPIRMFNPGELVVIRCQVDCREESC